MDNNIEHVKSLICKAAVGFTSDDAMKYAQAALNAANALRALSDLDVSNFRK
jgi:hypothetical protein